MKYRSLWLEAQNINYSGLQFYLRQGFALVGFDLSLYDPSDECILPNEVALFFSRDLR